METRTNLVDFATYRFARDLRLTEARDTAAGRDRHAGLLEATPPAPPLSDQAAAHRARMLEHLAGCGQRTAD
ncbi:MAG: hypothetical protein O2917_06560 [Acidobacteria bacterium]|nr:hypothetical protein [Acidobacteriota bacterium]